MVDTDNVSILKLFEILSDFGLPISLPKTVDTKCAQLSKITFGYACRSSHPEVFSKKGVLKNFVNFTRKNLCQSLFS